MTDYSDSMRELVAAMYAGHQLIEILNQGDASVAEMIGGIQEKVDASLISVDAGLKQRVRESVDRINEGARNLAVNNPLYIAAVKTLEQYRPDFEEAGKLADEIYESVPGLRPQPTRPERQGGLGWSPADEGGRRAENILP